MGLENSQNLLISTSRPHVSMAKFRWGSYT
ncbi:hypothetical protein Golob_004189 [Gossypium lobatum]|uniref:Uncharacterized protein n=1 Tax=Gossypium lobatum TaxID=34289 RepID=A0A7J8N0T7_9ROSI|nr:hypothetical protein [Gossypium lobatum]